MLPQFPKILILALALAAALGTTASAQDKIPVKITNGDRVYAPRNLQTGSTKHFVKPALIDSRQVFDATPEYQTIQRQKLDPESAEAFMLKRQASNRFRKAVARTLSSGGYDLIAETGAVDCGSHSPPDITQEVIANL